MNAKDQARLDELSARIYAKHAGNLLEKTVPAYYQSSDIETHGGRAHKAVAMLRENNVIEVHGGVGGRYVVVSIEKARQYEKAPARTINWMKFAKHANNGWDLDDYQKIGFKYFSDFSDQERIYIYFHKEEFAVRKSKDVPRYYWKQDLVLRDKFILKCLVELELKHNFPKYVQLFAQTEEVTCHAGLHEEFEFPMYALSTVFEQNKLQEILDVYTKHHEKVQAYRRSLEKTLLWVEEVGGFDKAIKLMRLQIILDLQEGFLRYPTSFMNHEATEPWRVVKSEEIDANRTKIALPYIKKVKHLLTYESLYGSKEEVTPAGEVLTILPDLGGEEILQVPTAKESYRSDDCDQLDITMEVEFDQQEGEGVANEAA